MDAETILQQNTTPSDSPVRLLCAFLDHLATKDPTLYAQFREFCRNPVVAQAVLDHET